MKLRTTSNSIRIRIRKSELAILQKTHKVEESIRFPNGVIFRFALTIDDNAEMVNAVLEHQNLVLSIPKGKAAKWMSTDEVGIEAHIDLPDNEKLHILIEKDFPCLDREEEDRSDTFWELAPDTPDSC